VIGSRNTDDGEIAAIRSEEHQKRGIAMAAAE
jgi:hypothetical protein